jgi:CheY-like chemotaxis protein
VQARTSREALDRVEREKIDVAILDQNMPQLSGLQVVKLTRVSRRRRRRSCSRRI